MESVLSCACYFKNLTKIWQWKTFGVFAVCHNGSISPSLTEEGEMEI